jgi:hypothetical protein
MGDDDVGAVRPADAASLIALEETHSDGAADADVAVAAPAESHPLQGAPCTRSST